MESLGLRYGREQARVAPSSENEISLVISAG